MPSGGRLGRPDVLEDHGGVEMPRRDPRERSGTVDELVLDVDVREPHVGERDDLRRELRERGEERPEPHAPAPQPDQLRDLLLRQREPALHLGRVPGQQAPGLGRPHALARAAQQRSPQLRLEQRDLAGDSRLREGERPSRGGQRARVDDHAQGGELPGIEHDHALGTRRRVQSAPLNPSAGS